MFSFFCFGSRIMKTLIVEMKQVGCNEVDKSMNEMEEFDYTVEQFADLQLLRYKVYGFEELSLKQKKLIYYLSQAALQGRDILFDQNGKYNLLIHKMLETGIYRVSGRSYRCEFRQFGNLSETHMVF